MKYYISDTPLRLREFGRNVQAMVEYAQTIEDDQWRTDVAHEIVRIMTNLNPSLKENPDYKQKLWDAIHIISDFDLDVDSPYEPPTREQTELHLGPRMDYYRGKPKYKQYGKGIELMVQKAIEMDEGPKRETYINLIVNTMRQFLFNSGRGDTPEETVIEHLRDMSGGKIRVKLEDLHLPKLSQHSTQPSNQNNQYSRPKSKPKKRSRGKRKSRSK